MGKRLLTLAAVALAFLLILPYALSEFTTGGRATPESASGSSPVAPSTSKSSAPEEMLPQARGNAAFAQEAEPTGEDATEASTKESPNDGTSGIIEERTPLPTATPGRLEEGVAHIAQVTGLRRVTFLGLTGEDWINLAISLLIVVGAYLLASWLIRGLLRRLVQRSRSEFDDNALAAIGPHLKWLIVILCLSFATARLDFVSADLKQILDDLYFLAGGIVAVVVCYRIINLGLEQYQEHVVPEKDRERLEPVLTLIRRVAIVFVVVAGGIVVLSHFGVNVTALTASLGIAGLALSLAAQDTLSDAISGVIILLDQPFRVGDRIAIAQENTWGDVVEIGTRTTRIRTRDNRMVIVPNSLIGKSQVVNYTFPDPQYRVETHLGIAYGTNIEEARRIIVETVQKVPGVLTDRPVDALYNEMGDSAMIFRVRWWIESYVDTRRVYDRVHTALQEALDAADINMPYPTQTVNLKVEPGEASQLPRAIGRNLPAR